MANLAWELFMFPKTSLPSLRTHVDSLRLSVPICLSQMQTNEFPSLSQKEDTILVLPPPATEKQTLPLQNTVLSRSAWLLEMQTGVLKRWKGSWRSVLGFWRVPLGRSHTVTSSFQIVTFQSCLLQTTDFSHLTSMVAALAQFPPNLKVSLGFDTKANAQFSEHWPHSVVPVNWQTGTGRRWAASADGYTIVRNS